MNAELLLREFRRVADSPEAVEHLRDFIRELAVSGLLLDPNQDDWRDYTLGELGDWGSGGTPNKGHPEYYNGDIPWLVIGDLTDGLITSAQSSITDLGLANSSAKLIEQGTVLIAMYGSIGKLGLAGIRCATNQAIAHCVVNRALVTPHYLMIALRAMRGDLLGRGQGGTQANISQTILKAWPIRLPPTEEQLSIVAKVDELIALCDKLEAAQKEREARRDRLRAASLNRLTASDGEAELRQADVRFFLDASPRLITKPEHVAAIRDTILDLAVRGWLLQPDPDGASADVQWRPLRELLDLITDGDHATPARIERAEGSIPLVTAKNVRDGSMDYTVTDWVAKSTAVKSWQRCQPRDGDILMVCVGATIGRLCVLRNAKAMVLVRSVALLRPSRKVLVEFLALCLRSPTLQSQVWGKVKATGQPCLYLGRIQELTIPIPNLPEQDRTIAKVNELMHVCDALEAALTSAQNGRARLLEALLHQALAGGPVRSSVEMETAV